MSAAKAKPLAEDKLVQEATANLNALTGLLNVPIPLLLTLFFAVRGATKATAGTTDPSFWGVPIPVQFGLFLVMGFNALILLNVARITSLLHACWEASGRAEAVTRAITGNAAILNPFHARDGKIGRVGYFGCPAIETVLDMVPTFTVGLLLGFVAMVALPAPYPGVAWEAYWRVGVIVTVLMHTAGIASAMIAILWLIGDVAGRLRWLPYGLGLIAGGYLAYLAVFAAA